MRLNPNDPPILVSDKEAFSEALLPINETRNQMMNIERLAGAKDKYAGTVSNELIKDFQLATSYPPEERDFIAPDELTGIVKGLTEKLVSERQRANQNSDELT